MKKILLVGILVLVMALVTVHAECVDGEVKKSSESEESGALLFFKNIGCSIQQGATKVQDGAKSLGEDIKEKAEQFGESTKEFGSDVKTKFGEIKDKITS